MSVIYIGSAIGDGGIRGRLEQRVQDPQRYFDPASKQAWRSGLTVEASWAATTNKAEAKRYEAALLRTYRVEHDHLPGITIDGKWIRGNKQTPGQREVPREELHWSEWAALYHIDYTTERSKELFAIIPTSPGVYRFRVAESDHANALARTSVPGSKRAPSPRTPSPLTMP